MEEWRFAQIYFVAQNTEIVSLEGQVDIQRAGTTEWSPADLKAKLVVGDMIRTSKSSRARLRSADRSDFNVEELTQLTVSAPGHYLPGGDIIAVPARSRVEVFIAPRTLFPTDLPRSSAQNEKDPDPPPASERWRIP